MMTEGRQRSLAHAIAPYPLEAESALFTFKLKSGGEEFRMAPIPYVESLTNFVHSLLEDNERYVHINDNTIRIIIHVHVPQSLRAGQLTWHGNLIPEDEIWLKIGGDKGGESFKMSLQIANLANPKLTS